MPVTAIAGPLSIVLSRSKRMIGQTCASAPGARAGAPLLYWLLMRPLSPRIGVLRRIVVIADFDIEPLLAKHAEFDKSDRIETHYGAQAVVKPDLIRRHLDIEIVNNQTPERRIQLFHSIKLLYVRCRALTG